MTTTAMIMFSIENQRDNNTIIVFVIPLEMHKNTVYFTVNDTIMKCKYRKTAYLVLYMLLLHDKNYNNKLEINKYNESIKICFVLMG